MSEDPQRWISYNALTELAATEAAERDRDGAFPEGAFAGLRRLGLIGKPPLQASETACLLRVLAAIGRGNLSVGRIYEGHVNALLLIQWFGSPAQRERSAMAAKGGALFGVWNTDLANDPARVESGNLKGAKSFASGVDGLNQAVITVARPEGRQMLIVPVKDLLADRAWWKPLGMRASGSHVVNFNNLVGVDSMLGAPDDYLVEPFFSAGVIRCAAAHVGGTHAVFDAALKHLQRTGRAQSPHQRHRLGRMATEVAAGYAWLDYAAGNWARMDKLPAAAVIACMNAARGAIERAALNVMELAERSVGVAGMLEPHPLERLSRDLRTYLRQPNPDGALASVGAAVADGVWLPDENGLVGVHHGQ
ncbi:MAG TPA: acyl-CoA dehydrogenase family protein [Bradyrhizobium sp.]|nr:acyl-CoA dehydrogenase family protein [Bradyrhizobium sp.]